MNHRSGTQGSDVLSPQPSSIPINTEGVGDHQMFAFSGYSADWTGFFSGSKQQDIGLGLSFTGILTWLANRGSQVFFCQFERGYGGKLEETFSCSWKSLKLSSEDRKLSRFPKTRSEKVEKADLSFCISPRARKTRKNVNPVRFVVSELAKPPDRL